MTEEDAAYNLAVLSAFAATEWEIKLGLIKAHKRGDAEEAKRFAVSLVRFFTRDIHMLFAEDQ
jgi:hypothetical protein